MEFTKEDLINTKEIIYTVLNNQKNNSKSNIKMKEYSFNQEIYPIITTLGLSTMAFNESILMKSIAILSTILTYEELRYILINLKNILITKKKLNLLQKAKYDQLLKELSLDEIKEINYLETENKGSYK